MIFKLYRTNDNELIILWYIIAFLASEYYIFISYFRLFCPSNMCGVYHILIMLIKKKSYSYHILFSYCSGTMKCLLNGVLEQRDTVCMNLFKRAYPKWPTHHFPLSE